MNIEQVSILKSLRVLCLRNVLSGLIYFHLFILFFQIPLRAIILDFTFWRDIGIFLIILVWFAYRLIFCKITFSKKISLEKIVTFFIFYGIINVFVNLIDGVSLLGASTSFRNHFFPFLLFFPACYVFKDVKNQKQLMYFLSLILFVYMLTPLIEVILKNANFPLSQIPWYHHSFNNSTRFEGSESGAYIDIENSPILGLLGYPHYTVVTIVALFALIYPFLFAELDSVRDGSNFKIGTSKYHKFFLLFLFFSSILIFQVRTHMISAFLVLFLFAPRKMDKRKNLILVLALLLFLIFFSFFDSGGLGSIAERFIVGFIGNDDNISSFSAIMSVNELYFLINSDLIDLFFGHGYNAVSNVTFDEFLQVNSTGWEVKLLFYTAVYGLLWLILFIWINVKALAYVKLNYKLFDINSFQYLYSHGFKVMIIVFLIDAGHYMRMMAWPNLDIWIICLAVLTAINSKGGNRELELNS